MKTALSLVFAAAILTPVPGSAEDANLARGKEVYASERCAMCHAIGGAGNRRHPLDGVGSRLNPDQIRKWIVAPQEMDPKVKKQAHDKLPASDLNALVDYLSSLKAN